MPASTTTTATTGTKAAKPATKPGKPPTPGPALSTGTRHSWSGWTTCLAALAAPNNDETPDALWTAHVRSATTPEGEPLFNEAALKLAFVELVVSRRNAQS